MIRLCSICVILLSACSQPFEFELEDASIVVIDAKVSTAPDASFVRIYTQADSSKLFLPNYQVSVESDNEVISFSYDQNSSSYLPDNNGFTAIPGRRYRLEAISLEGHLLSSEYDAAPELTNFELDIKDTSVFELNNSILVEKRAKTAVADVITKESLSKFTFSYLYVHYFTKDTLIVSRDNDFVLLDHTNSNQEVLRVEISSEPLEDFWTFANPACGSYLPPCGLPCCIRFSEYQVWFRIQQETISEATYNYWEEVARLTRGDGLVFDSFPFPMKGNISCENCEGEVVGLFRAVSENSRIKATNL